MLYAPCYAASFKCIADKCKNSCCAQLEIEVDGDTLLRYEALCEPQRTKILDTVNKTAEGAVFFTDCDKRCLNLNKDGLCRIILECGEGYLCDICREHPRFYNSFSCRSSHGAYQRCEMGLGMACEAAAALILESENYSDIRAYGEDSFTDCGEFAESEVDILAERKRIYGMLSERGVSSLDKINSILKLYSVNIDKIDDATVLETYFSLEYLDLSHRELFFGYKSNPNVPASFDIYLERFFAYLIYRYLPYASDSCELSTYVGLSALLTRLFASLMLSCKDKYECYDMARIISCEIEYSIDNIDEIIFLIDAFAKG